MNINTYIYIYIHTYHRLLIIIQVSQISWVWLPPVSCQDAGKSLGPGCGEVQLWPLGRSRCLHRHRGRWTILEPWDEGGIPGMGCLKCQEKHMIEIFKENMYPFSAFYMWFFFTVKHDEMGSWVETDAFRQPQVWVILQFGEPSGSRDGISLPVWSG